MHFLLLNKHSTQDVTSFHLISAKVYLILGVGCKWKRNCEHYYLFLVPKFVFMLGMGRTWEKFSSLRAKKPQKFETATGKENF